MPGETQGFVPDKSQLAIIEAPAHEWMIVGAGPGTGKTATACARIAHLINDEGVAPNRIWFISFTRTAVAELRARVGTHLTETEDQYSIRLATLDSQAWALHSGFEETARITSYEENISKLIALVRTSSGLAEHLELVRHLLVDESQDIVGSRAELMVAFIERLSHDCGVTVFADEAQAIYGFTTDASSGAASTGTSPTLPERLRNTYPGRFRERELDQQHRTDSGRLQSLFSTAREKVLAEGVAPAERFATVRNAIVNLADGAVGKANAAATRERLATYPQSFYLFRTRAEALQASSMLADLPHRLRLSGFPAPLPPWLGACLAPWTSSRLTEPQFADLWHSGGGDTTRALDLGVAWNHLVRLAGETETVVDMALLRQRLGRAQPPADLSGSELGEGGTVIGTIHASKGREAKVVLLALPQARPEEDDDEESRVIFVGATRARDALFVGDAPPMFTSQTKSGRAFSTPKGKVKSQPQVQVEFGRLGDVTAESMAGRSLHSSEIEVETIQARLKLHMAFWIELAAHCQPGQDFSYRLSDKGGRCYGYLAKTVNSDLFEIKNKQFSYRRLRPGDHITHLRLLGSRTIVIPPDAPEREELHSPWRESGFLLAPMIVGYSMVYYRRY